MPSYKTHSIHGELILSEINKKIYINKEDLKTFCIGPDTLIATDYKIFDYQHANRVKDFFTFLIEEIKQRKLYENSEIMAYLYGQIDHFVLDVTTHPLIYYFTESAENDFRLGLHGLMEMWLDDYMCLKYDKNQQQYYHKNKINDLKLKTLINDVYLKIYNGYKESSKYEIGIEFMKNFDLHIRRNKSVIPFITKLLNLGDITYEKDGKRVLPYLNLNHELWLNPETGEKSYDSFEDLWYKSLEISQQTIEDVNNYIYLDKPLNNELINNNISYNTGLPCELGQSYKYIKKKYIKY